MYQATNGQTYAHSQTKCCVASAHLVPNLQSGPESGPAARF